MPRKIADPLQFKIFLTVFLINLIYIKSYIGDQMVLSMLDLTVSIVDRGKLDIDPYAGNSNDVAYHGGHFYSGMAPGPSILAIPYDVALKPVVSLVRTPARDRRVDELFLRAKAAWRPSANRLGILLLGLVVTALGCTLLAGMMAVLFHRALGLLYPELEESRRLATTWLFSFGTLFFYYSSCLEHRFISTVLCFWAYVLFLAPQGSSSLRWRATACGLALGAAVATSYEVVLVVACVGVFGLARWGRGWPWAWTCAGAILLLALLAAYHTVCFGHPWSTPYAARYWVHWPPTANASAGAKAPLLSLVSAALSRPLGRAADLLIGQRYGVLFYSPPLVLAFPALAYLKSQRALRSTATLAMSIFTTLIMLHFFTGYEGTAGEFGFRFMLPSLPWLMLLVPLTYRWSYRTLVPILAAAAAVVVGKGVMYGAATKPGFWTEYQQFLSTYGLSTYTFCNLKDHVLPALSPLVITVMHMAVLSAVLLGLRFWVWRPREKGVGRGKAPASGGVRL